MTLTPSKTTPSAVFAVAMSEAPAGVSAVTSRWTSVPGGVVDGGEIVLLATKPSLWRPVLDSSAWLVTCVLLAATLLVSGKTLPGLSATTTAQVILLIGIVRLAVAVVHWITKWHLLTNRRIIDVHGVRAPQIRSCLLIHVRNTYLRISPVEKLLTLGTVLFVTDEPEHRPHLWQSVPYAEEVHAKIRRAIENALDQHGV